jgi:hypothetical protein
MEIRAKHVVSPASKHSQANGCSKDANISTALDKSFGLHKENTSIVDSMLKQPRMPQGEAKPKK